MGGWPPNGIEVPEWWLKTHHQREPSMSEVTSIGLDLAKHVFQSLPPRRRGCTGSMRAVRWFCASSYGAAK